MSDLSQTKVKHELKRMYDGKGIISSITPTCSCGWKGRPEYAHNDWQYINLQDQESEHFAQVRKKEKENNETHS